jgi:hypothetical protein
MANQVTMIQAGTGLYRGIFFKFQEFADNTRIYQQKNQMGMRNKKEM